MKHFSKIKPITKILHFILLNTSEFMDQNLGHILLSE